MQWAGLKNMKLVFFLLFSLSFEHGLYVITMTTSIVCFILYFLSSFVQWFWFSCQYLPSDWIE